MVTLAKQDTFTVTKAELRQMLTALGIPEKSIGGFLSTLEKTHRHTNIIVFASLLEKLGIDRPRMANIFRRMGMEDITINNAFRMIDESKITAETGRLYEAEIKLE
ncbi:MAG: hypothetical protein ABSE71_05390 [Candidatus Micrarchaeaceae archaeon]